MVGVASCAARVRVAPARAGAVHVVAACLRGLPCRWPAVGGTPTSTNRLQLQPLSTSWVFEWGEGVEPTFILWLGWGPQPGGSGSCGRCSSRRFRPWRRPSRPRAKPYPPPPRPSHVASRRQRLQPPPADSGPPQLPCGSQARVGHVKPRSCLPVMEGGAVRGGHGAVPACRGRPAAGGGDGEVGWNFRSRLPVAGGGRRRSCGGSGGAVGRERGGGDGQLAATAGCPSPLLLTAGFMSAKGVEEGGGGQRRRCAPPAGRPPRDTEVRQRLHRRRGVRSIGRMGS